MKASERERVIMDALLERKEVSVAELSRALDVSEVTVRGDLSAMEERGLLSRVHGGAVPAVHAGILERRALRMAEKQEIARAAAALCRDGDAVFVEAGTTAALVCRYLSERRGLHVITNSVLAFNEARGIPALKVTVAGGVFNSSTESFTGPAAMDTLRRFNVRWAFAGADGFGAERGITANFLEAAEMFKVMKERAERVVLLADSSKYGRAGQASIMPLSAMDGVITDAGISADAAAEMKADAGIMTVREDRGEKVCRFWFNTISN